MNSSGDWQDLAAIEAKINKLGFGGLYCSAFYLFNSMPMISRSDVVEKQLLSVLSPSLRLSLLFFSFHRLTVDLPSNPARQEICEFLAISISYSSIFVVCY